MKANPSNRWKNEAVELVEERDFTYKGAYDAGKDFRKEDHCCDFCGSHLRYTAIIISEDDEEIEREVGLDCLEHVFGTSWSRLQEVERDIKDLKKEAKRRRRKEAYQEEYGKVIEWIEEYLDIKSNGFLRDMYNILTTGSREFTRGMEDAVRDIVDETNLDELRKEQRRKEREYQKNNERIELLKSKIIEQDDIEVDKNGNPVEDVDNSSFEFVDSVHGFLQNAGYITDEQMKTLNDIYSEYTEGSD